ncbi:DUF2147 domain-containing protein [Neisseriaceae bacterium PsAf]|nr:DUF2147 domain-containing protein [Neisseriaceae bacterium PsAf]MCV2503777.1 DUF2147 domain-containing protein [Neisseriaceae bacterium]
MSKKLLFVLMFSMATLTSAASIEGKWKTIDDKSNQPKSIIEITKSGNTYVGKVTELLPAATATVCDKCTGANKNKPIKGMTILTGLKKVNDTDYENGKVFDPESGNTYSGSAKLINGGKSLELRGYVGIKLLGRSQTWQRVQ